jgi:Asp-tRNA(Asn)/Glu-tRNA(Gln) amidotransferase A subunit family amidase
MSSQALRNREPSAVEWLRRLKNREISSVELVTATAARIERVNPRVNAVVADNLEQCLAEARAADERRQRGEDSPLLGLPITVKDSIDVAGYPCTGGSFARENFRPKKDSTVAARLRAAGAIILAKTNLPEYSSSYETDNAIFGCTRHPLDPARTPGGSTGGEAALLGADASIVGIGLDGGGSIRVPSHYCGVVGIRPTVGRVPDTGSWPETRDTGYRDLMCIGPMARYVEDLALLLRIISGPDWIDPYAVPAPLGDISDVDLSKLRIGFYDFDGVARVSPQTSEAVARAAGAIADAGAAVRSIEPPDVQEATEIFFSMAGADGGARTWRDLEGANGRHHEQFQTLLDGFGDPLSLADFFDLQGRFFAFRARLRSFLNDLDAIICPVTTGPAPMHMEPPWGIQKDDYFLYQGFNYTHAFSVGGLPVAVAPAGKQDGLPLGVQIAARPYEEHLALATAAQLECALGGFQAPSVGAD